MALYCKITFDRAIKSATLLEFSWNSNEIHDVDHPKPTGEKLKKQIKSGK